MAKAKTGERPNDKKTKSRTPSRSSSVDAFIQQQLDHDLARSIIRVDTTVDVCTEKASKHCGTAATGGYRPKNNDINYFQGTNDATAIGTGRTQRMNGTNGNNCLSPFISTGRRDPHRHPRNVNDGNKNTRGNGITSYGHSNISTPTIHLTGVEESTRMRRHANSRNDHSKKHVNAPSPSLSPSARKSSSRVGKPKRGSPATERQRQSKFVEEMMRDKVSTVPPPQFLGEHPTANGRSRATKAGNEDGKTASPAKKHGLRKKISALFNRSSFSHESKRAKPASTAASPVNEVDSLEDRKATAEKEYGKLKAQGFRGTAKGSHKGSQLDMPSAVPATPAAIDHPTPALANTTRSKGLTSSKSFLNLPSAKRRGSASTLKKLVTKQSKLTMQLEEIKKQIKQATGEEAQDEQPVDYSEESDINMPVIAPGPRQIQNTKKGRHGRHGFVSRPLPSIPSERLINQIAEDEEKDEQAPTIANTRYDFVEKELPPPPCSALKASLRGEKKPKPAIKHTTDDNEKTENRKRKGAMAIEEPEFNEDEYLRAFRSYDNEKDSDYSHDDGPATSDTNADFDYTSERRHLPSRRAKLARTNTENRTVAEETPIPPRRSSRNLRNRYSADYPVSVTPGEKGHEDVPPVPPVPAKLPRRSGRKKKNREEDKENLCDEELDQYQWPSDIF